MIYFNEPYLTIHWEDDIQAVWMEWKHGVEGEPFRRGMNVGIELLQQKKGRRWLGDILNLGAVTPADSKWSAEEWFPRVIGAGLRWMALIQPRKVVTKMTMKITMTKVQDGNFVTAYFSELDEARAWLREQK